MRRFSPLVLSLALVVVGCSGNDASVFESTSTSGGTTTGAASVTTAAPATTEAPATTAAPTTATPTTAPATTAPPTTAAPDPLVFTPFGLGVADFGDAPDPVIAAVTARLGAPSADSGWIAGGGGPYGVCPGSEYRRVEYLGGNFNIQFTDAGYFAAEGTRQFYAYAWSGGSPGPTPGPPISIDAGSTVDQVVALYPGAEIIPDDVFFGPVFRVQPGGWAQLWGRLTGTTPSDTVINVLGGVGCGE